MPTWPSTLPQSPRFEGYQETTQKAFVRTEMEAGAPKQRPRYTAAADYITCSFAFTAVQLATFITFYKTTTGFGSFAFDMPHPRTGVTVSVRIPEPYTLQKVGPDLYFVSLKLEILP